MTLLEEIKFISKLRNVDTVYFDRDIFDFVADKNWLENLEQTTGLKVVSKRPSVNHLEYTTTGGFSQSVKFVKGLPKVKVIAINDDDLQNL